MSTTRLVSTVSVIIPCRNEREHLRPTIDSILNAGLDPRFEVIVVDDGSQDGSSAFLAERQYSRIRLIQHAGLGAALARNTGAQYASGDLLVFCDAHIRVGPGWLEYLLRAFSGTPLDAACTAIASLERPADVGYGGTWDERLAFKWLPNPGTNGPALVPIAPSGCLAVRRPVFDGAGGFERGFRVWGYEDQEFSLRLWLLGHQVYVLPGIKVLHYFRPRHPYPVSFTHVDFNLLWMAFVHFNQNRFARTVQLIQGRSPVSSLLTEIGASPEALARRNFCLSRRRYDDDWFMRRFGIPF